VESTPRLELKSAFRTFAFALLAIAILLGLATEQYQTATHKIESKKAALYVRGGNTFMGLYYLARGANWGEDEVEGFLENAQNFYVAAVKADPQHFRARLSEAMFLRAIGDLPSAVQIMPPVVVGQHPQEEREVLKYVFAIVGTGFPARSSMEKSRNYIFGYGPGPLMLARAYQEMGDPDRAEQMLSEAAAAWRPLLYRMIAAAVFNGLMVLIGLIGLTVALLRHRRLEPTPLPIKGWGMREAIEALILWITAMGVLGIGVALQGEPPLWLLLLPSVLAALLALDWVWLTAGFRPLLGWELTAVRRQVVIGLCAAGLVVMPALGVNQIFLTVLGRSSLDNPVIPLLVAPDRMLDKVTLIIGAGFLAPILEESLFRGVFFGALRQSWSFWPAAIASSTLFALVHFDPAGAVSYFLLGMTFAYLFERTRSLVAPAAAHAGFNLFNLVVILTVFG
jgi:membrane protease YdiL (CAAX protease family)